MRVWRADCARCFGSRNFLAAVSSVLVLLFFSISAEPFFPASLEWKSVYDFFSEIFKDTEIHTLQITSGMLNF